MITKTDLTSPRNLQVVYQTLVGAHLKLERELRERRSLMIEKPVCLDMITTDNEGQPYKIGAVRLKVSKHYFYTCWWPEKPYSELIWIRNADEFDDVIALAFKDKLRWTFNSKVWKKALASYPKVLAELRERKMPRLICLEERVNKLLADLRVCKDKETFKNLENRYSRELAIKTAIVSEIHALESEAELLHQISSSREAFHLIVDHWSKMDRESKRLMLQVWIQRVHTIPSLFRGSLRLIIYWKDGSKKQIDLHSREVGTEWFQYETDELLVLIDSGCDQYRILRSFPLETWGSLMNKLRFIKGYSNFQPNPKPIEDHETSEDYVDRTPELQKRVKVNRTYRTPYS